MAHRFFWEAELKDDDGDWEAELKAAGDGGRAALPLASSRRRGVAPPEPASSLGPAGKGAGAAPRRIPCSPRTSLSCHAPAGGSRGGGGEGPLPGAAWRGERKAARAARAKGGPRRRPDRSAVREAGEREEDDAVEGSDGQVVGDKVEGMVGPIGQLQ